MGHIRLGFLPKTYRWKQVVELLIEGADVSEIADASFLAIQRSLRKIPDDPGFIIALTNIFKFIEAARSKDYLDSFEKEGYPSSKDSNLFDYLSYLRSQTDYHLEIEKVKSDLSELVQNSFSETILRSPAFNTPELFGGRLPTEVIKTSGLKGRALVDFMHEFYSGFVNKYLSYYLSRELPIHVGSGRVFQNIDEHKGFSSAFDLYVRQSVRISKEFTPGWLGKAIYEKELSYDSVSKYAHVAFKKIAGEFGREAQKID